MFDPINEQEQLSILRHTGIASLQFSYDGDAKKQVTL